MLFSSKQPFNLLSCSRARLLIEEIIQVYISNCKSPTGSFLIRTKLNEQREYFRNEYFMPIFFGNGKSDNLYNCSYEKLHKIFNWINGDIYADYVYDIPELKFDGI